jgi:hypothetical protein
MSGPYFESGYIDASYFEGDGTTQEASATLTSQFTQSATGSRLKGGSSTLNTQFTQSVSTDKIVSLTGINFVFSNNVITLTYTVLKSFNVSINSQFDKTFIVGKVHSADADLSGALSATLTATALKNHTAVLDASVSFTATASRFTGTEQTLNNIITLSLQGTRARVAQSSLSAQFSKSTQIETVKDINSTLNTEFTQSTSGGKLVGIDANLTAQFTQSTSGSVVLNLTPETYDAEFTISTAVTRQRNTSVAFSTAFTQTCDFSEIDDFVVSVSSQFNQSTAADRLRDVDSDLNTEFTVTTTGTRIHSGAGTLSAQASISTAISVVFEPGFQTSDEPGSDSLDLTFTQSVTVNTITDTSIILSGAFTPSITTSATKLGEIVLSSQFRGRNGGAFLAKQSVLTRSTQIETKNSGIFQTRFRIDSNTKKFGAGSLAEDFVSAPANTDLRDSVFYNQTVWDGTYYWQIGKGYSHYSTDGINWSRSTNNLSFQPLTIEYLNSKIVTIDNANKTIYHSTNGTTFTSVSANMSSTRIYNTYDIQYFNGHYIFQSSEYNSSTNTTQIFFHYYNSSFTSAPAKRYSYSTSAGGQIVFAGAYNGKLYYVINDGSYADNTTIFQRIKPIQISYVNSTITFTDADQFIFNNTGSTPTGITTSSGTGWSVQDSVIDSSGEFYFTLLHTATGEMKTASGYTFNQSMPNTGFPTYVKYFEFTSTNQPSVWTRYLYIVNGVFVMPTLHGYYTENNWSDLGSNPAIDLADVLQPVTVYKFISFANSKYFLQANGRFHITSDITSAVDWTVSDLDVDDRVADITIRSGPTSTARLSDFNTLDFWARVEPNSNLNNGQVQREIFFYTDTTTHTLRLTHSASQSKVSFQMLTAGSDGSTNLSTQFVYAPNDWHHVRYVYDNTGQSLFVNGSRVATSTNVPYFNTEKSLVLRHLPTYFSETPFFDDFRLYDTQLSAVSDTTYTVPTAPFENDSNTLLLMNFDTAIQDNSEFQIVEQADLSSAFTQTAIINYAVGNLQSNQSSAFSFSVDAIKFIDASANLSAQFSQSTQSQRFRSTNIDVDSAFTQTATGNLFFDGTSDLNTQFSITTDISVIKQGTIELDAFNTQLTAASKIGDFLVTFDVSFTKDFSAIKTTDITKTLSSEGTLSADVSRTRSTSSTLSAANTVSVTAQRTRSGDATFDSVLSISTDAVKTTDTSSDLNVVILLTAESLPIRQFASALSVAFSTQTNAVITADAQSTLNSAFTQSAEPVADLEGSADLDSAFTISLTPTVTKTFVIELDAFNTVISTVAKIGDFLVTFDTAFSISATARVIRAEDLDLQSEFTQSLIANRIQQGASTLNAVFSQTATGVNQYELEADLDSAVTLNTNAVKTVSAEISIASAGDFVLTVAVSRTTDIDLINTTSVVVVAERFRFTPTTMASVSTMSINAGIKADAQAVLSVQFGIVAPTDVVHIDELVYVVPTETREFTIKSEQRTVTIDSEQREYTVKK